MKMCQIPLDMDDYKMGGLVTTKEFIWRIAHVTLLQGIKPFYESFQNLPKFINIEFYNPPEVCKSKILAYQ